MSHASSRKRKSAGWDPQPRGRRAGGGRVTLGTASAAWEVLEVVPRCEQLLFTVRESIGPGEDGGGKQI